MNYQDHPTWRMLEQGKKGLKNVMVEVNVAINQMPDFLREEYEMVYDRINAQHKKLVSLQLKVEDKINQHD